MKDITPKEAIANLNRLYGMVAPDIQRSLDVAIKALERLQGEWKMIINAFQETKYQCNQCKHYTRVGDDRNFCPNCGAKMTTTAGASNEKF